ncbi:MAG: DUF927 domain-containing protein, partial [Longispora sp.]|nr:DUF927 domain-containing protein [Longispora sp. (in: high G+C Gram-positive bacteria)]
MTYSPRGEVINRQVTIEVDGLSATVPLDVVADGSVWITRFPGAAGVGERDIRDALRNIVDDQAAQLELTTTTPVWVDDRLVLPPVDVLPAGYIDTVGEWDDFVALVRAVATAPRIALTMGLAVSGMYVKPLSRQSFVVHLPGEGRSGKTTAARCAAAVFGNPHHVVKAWDTTPNGVPSWLRRLSCLTGFRDELGASGLGPEKLSTLVFRITQGAERDMSNRRGGHQESQGSWHGALVSTGNETIVGRMANEGIAARVVEISAPMTTSGPQADQLDKLLRNGYGHGLAAIVNRALTPAEFDAWANHAADADLVIPSGGPVRTIGQHLSMGVAGARLLAELCGIPEFLDAAIDAGRQVLTELANELDERGARPGDRLLAAIGDAMASCPAEWPTRLEYAEAARFGKPMREICGWDLTNDPLLSNATPDAAVISVKLKDIARNAGIDDLVIALRDLTKRGFLHTAGDGRNRARGVPVAGKSRRAYVFSGVHLAEVPSPEDLSNHPTDNDYDSGYDSVTTAVTTPDQARYDSYDISKEEELERSRQLFLDDTGAEQTASPCGFCTQPLSASQVTEVCGFVVHVGACEAGLRAFDTWNV